MGEYARSLAIARAARARWADAAIHFVLSERAPYAVDTPFDFTLLPSSPTFHSAAVGILIASFRPDVVIFDNAGRTAQLSAARAAGAAVVYISARRRQWRKAHRLRWLGLLDEHWVAYPKFLAGGANLLERCKLRLRRGPALRYLDVVAPPADPARRGALLAQIGCSGGSLLLVVPGGGGGHPGAEDAAQRFYGAAVDLAAAGADTVFVGRARAEPPFNGAALRRFDCLPQADLMELMRAARLVVVNGGSTLIQAMACGAACIGVPIAKDQARRIRGAAAAGVAAAAPLDRAAIVSCARRLLADEPARGALAARASALALADGISVAVGALERLLANRGARGAAAAREASRDA